MANERSYTKRNVGSKEKPIWEIWFAITVADAVLMSDKKGETKTIVDYINEKIAELIGTTETKDILSLTEISKYIEELKDLINKINETLESKVNKEQGKMLSTNDYTLKEKEKLNGIEEGAEVNVQADWNEKNVTSNAYVKNKPSALKNPEALTFTGGIYESYDGSEAKTIAIPRSVSELENDIGFACTESPIFTGTAEAPTAEESANDTRIATTAFVKAVINALINGAPETLDTLGEVAEAFAENETILAALNEAIGKKLGKTETAAAASKWETGKNINGLIIDGTSNRANYGTCSTAAATATKTVECAGFGLILGAEITVKFTVTNTAANPTLNVSGTGAKPVFYRGAAIPAGYLAANRTYIFRYNGTQWELVGDINTNTTYGLATASTRGLVKIGYTENGKNYPVELSNEQMYVNVPWTDTKYSDFVKSGADAAAGLVPKPSTTAGTNKYLREDGTWQTPPNTTYGAATQSANGLMSAADKKKLDGISTGANKVSVTNNLLATVAGTALDAVQGKALDDKINQVYSNLSDLKSYKFEKIGSTNSTSGSMFDISNYDFIVLYSTYSSVDNALGNCSLVSTKLILQSGIKIGAYTADYIAMCEKFDNKKVKIKTYATNYYAVLYGISF